MDTVITQQGTIFKRFFTSGGDFIPVYTAPALPPSGGFSVCQPTIFAGIAASPFADREYFISDLTRRKVIAFDRLNQPDTLGIATAGGRGVNSPLGLAAQPVGQTWRLGMVEGRDAQVFRNEDTVFTAVYACSTGQELICVGQFQFATAITFDDLGNWFVADSGANEVAKFDRNGNFVLRFGRTGSGDGEFNGPAGIAFYDRVVYVADSGNSRIVRYVLNTDIRP